MNIDNESDKLQRRILPAVMELVGQDRSRAERWMNTRLKNLGDETPLEHAVTKEGLQDVIDLIGRQQHGVFS